MTNKTKSYREIHAEKFSTYVIDALKRTGLRQAEVARRSSLSPQIISQLVNKKPHSLTGKLLLPERETVIRIAKAFGDPPEIALKAAGYDVPSVDVDEVERQMLAFFRELSKDGQSIAFALLHTLHSREMAILQEKREQSDLGLQVGEELGFLPTGHG